MKKSKKLSTRILSLLLVLALLCSMLPAGVFAQEAASPAVTPTAEAVSNEKDPVTDKTQNDIQDKDTVTDKTEAEVTDKVTEPAVKPEENADKKADETKTEEAAPQNKGAVTTATPVPVTEVVAAAEKAAEGNKTVATADYSYDGEGNLTIKSSEGTTAWRNDKNIGITNVVSVIINAAVTDIDDNAFDGCVNLTGVIMRSEAPPDLGADVFNGMPPWFYIVVPTEESMAVYKDTVGWEAYASHFSVNQGGYSYEAATGTLYVYTNDGFKNWKEAIPGKQTIKPEEIKALFIRNTANNVPDNAFENCTNLEKVTITSFLQTIGASAFENCTSLKAFEIPESVATIGTSAFKSSGLRALELPASITAVGKSSFENCKSLESIVISAGPNRVETYVAAFKGCTALEFVSIPHTFNSFGGETFSGCSNPDLVIWINCDTPPALNRTAFDGLADTARIMVPSQYLNRYKANKNYPEWMSLADKIVGVDMGYTFDSDTQTLTITSDIGTLLWRSDKSIGGEENVKKVIVKDGVKTIMDGAFASCKSLTAVELPNTLTTIGNRAFRRCTVLPTIQMPDSVTAIGADAFEFCDALTAFKFPDQITKIEEGTFYGCDSLAEVQLPYKLETIGDSAFEFCTALLKIDIPQSVTTIENDAFKHCDKLYYADLPDGLKTLGAMAFAYDISLDSMEIPESITRIEEYTFLGCKSMSFTAIPASVNFIGTLAFGDTYSMETILVTGDTPATMEDSAFGILAENAEIYVPEKSLETYKKADFWKDYANNIKALDKGYDFKEGTLTITNELGFSLWKENGSTIKADDIKKVVIKDTVQTVLDGAFDGCKNLQTVEFADSVTSIGNYAFSDCTNLTAINLPAKLETIGMGAFSNCSNSALTKITIPASVTTIRNYAFLGCTNVTSFIVESTTPANLGGRAFDIDRENYTIFVPAGTIAQYKMIWPAYEERFKEAESKVVFDKLEANGASGTTTTTELTLSFDKDIDGLSADNIKLTGATKGALTKTEKAGEYKLMISDITVKNGENVTLEIEKLAENIVVTPASKTVAVWVKDPAPGPTPTPTPGPTPTPAPTPAPKPTPSNGGESNAKTGTTNSQTGTACAVVFLSIAGLAALGFKRKFSK